MATMLPKVALYKLIILRAANRNLMVLSIPHRAVDGFRNVILCDFFGQVLSVTDVVMRIPSTLLMLRQETSSRLHGGKGCPVAILLTCSVQQEHTDPRSV